MQRLTLSASLLALLSATANAQVFTPDPDHDHDEVIVTGVLADRNIDEIITNVSVLDRGEIVSDLRSTLGDTLDREPGVATTFFGAGASRPVLRGLGAERVLVLTNGIGAIDVSAASPDHQSGADGIDAERIEILRGPSALAYGGQAIGGVVNVVDGLIAEDIPDAGFSADAYGAYNSAFDGYEGAARGEAAFGPLVVTGSFTTRDFEDYDIPGGIESEQLLIEEGELDEIGEDAEGGILPNSFVETTTLAGGASFVFDGGFAGVAIRDTSSEYGLPGGHEHEHGEEELSKLGAVADAGEGGEEEEENPFIDLDQTRYDARAGFTLGDGFFRSLRLNGAYADYAHTEFEAPGEPGTVYEREGWEGRAEVRTGVGDWQGSFGAQALDTELFADGEEAFITPTDTSSFAVFGYQQYKTELSPFSVEGGLRVEWVELSNILAGERDFDLVSASVAAHFHPADPLFFGAEIAYTERAPNESELFADGIHLATRQFELGNPDNNEERGINYEATARYDTGALRFGGNVFLTEFDNFTVLLPGVLPGGITEVEDFPVFAFAQDDASFIGGELYAEAGFDTDLAGFNLRASVDYVEGELDTPALDGSDIDVPLLPPLTFNAEGEADFGFVIATAAVTVAADQDDAGPGYLPTEGYTVLDLGLSAGLPFAVGTAEEGRAEVFGQIRNVTDEEVRYSTSTLRDFAPAPGRNVRVGVRASF